MNLSPVDRAEAARTFGKVSVVQIASAKDGKPSSCSASYAAESPTPTHPWGVVPDHPGAADLYIDGLAPCNVRRNRSHLTSIRLPSGTGARIRIATIDHDDLGQMAIDQACFALHDRCRHDLVGGVHTSTRNRSVSNQ